MTTELDWRISSAASGLYAAAAQEGRAPPVDPRLSVLRGPASQLHAALEVAGIPPQRFFEHAVPLAAAIDNRRELAALVARRATGDRPTEEVVTRLADALRDLDTAFGKAIPGLRQELELRCAPLREQWEARGPGLLAAIGRSTDRELLVKRAEVLVVHPVAGGGGEPYPPYHAVSIEGVLANPHAGLPEVVRLGWLVSTLSIAQPALSERIARPRRVWIAKLSMLPATLCAAEEVELAAADEGTLRLALAAWRLVGDDSPAAGGDVDRLADTLDRWWQTFRQTPTAWPVALLALDQMLQEPS